MLILFHQCYASQFRKAKFHAYLAPPQSLFFQIIKETKEGKVSGLWAQVNTMSWCKEIKNLKSSCVLDGITAGNVLHSNFHLL